MDDHNFLQQLHTLKQQVLQLSPKHRPSTHIMASKTPSYRAYEDPFTAQLQDVKAQMGSMEGAFKELGQSLQQSLPADRASTNFSEAASVLPLRNHISLPSGPLFWQLFNSLRADVRTLDDRVANLETSVSDLEDRVDGLEPNQFTPASSTANSELGCPQSATEWPVNKNVNGDFRPCMLPELCKDMNGSQGSLPIPAEQPYWPRPTERAPVYPNILYPHQELPTYYTQWMPAQPQHEVPAQPRYEMQPRREYEANPRSDANTTSPAINRLHEQNDAIQYRINKIDRENETMLQAIRSLTQRVDRAPRFLERAEAELPSMSWPKPYETPEVRFRDREISRMDELLRIAQERLRCTEESISQKDAHIAQLRAERDEQRARESAEKSYQMKEQLNRYLDALDSKNAEIAELQDQLAQRDDALRRWQESWNELSDSYARADEHATGYKHAYYDSMVRAESDIQKASSDHEDEMTKLKEFCEEKDAVIQRQEDVIVRGGKLLEQRDEEIEDISRKLRAAEDDRKHARRTQERLDRLLGERDEEIDQMKAEAKLERILGVKSEEINHVKRDAELAPAESNAATVGEPSSERQPHSITWGDPLPTPAAPSWTPFPLPYRNSDMDRNTTSKREPTYVPSSHDAHPWVQVGESALQFERMPVGERRVYRWDGGAQGQESIPVKSEEQPPPRITAKKRGKRQRRYSHRHYPELDKQSSNSPGAGNWIPWDAETRGSVRLAAPEQGTGSLDDDFENYYWPPLPAPVTARRMASDANLHSHSYSHMGARKNLSKYHSMQELSKRASLQPFVESEAESAGGDNVSRKV